MRPRCMLNSTASSAASNSISAYSVDLWSWLGSYLTEEFKRHLPQKPARAPKSGLGFPQSDFQKFFVTASRGGPIKAAWRLQIRKTSGLDLNQDCLAKASLQHAWRSDQLLLLSWRFSTGNMIAVCPSASSRASADGRLVCSKPAAYLLAMTSHIRSDTPLNACMTAIHVLSPTAKSCRHIESRKLPWHIPVAASSRGSSKNLCYPSMHFASIADHIGHEMHHLTYPLAH